MTTIDNVLEVDAGTPPDPYDGRAVPGLPPASAEADAAADESGSMRGPVGPGGSTHGPRADGCPAGAPLPLNRVRFYPAKGQAARLLGGRFQGSNSSPTNDFVDLATIETTPQEGAYGELQFKNTQLFRYLKYYSPEGSHGSVAELEFFHDDVRLTGKAFGTASSGDAAMQYQSALDGATDTAFEGSLVDDNYVGLDVGEYAVVAAPTFDPAPGALTARTAVTLRTSTPGATIRYTLDGSNPTRQSGSVYGEPLNVSASASLKAIAFADCLFDSPIGAASYTVGSITAETKGQKSYHVGNSLTDTINPWLEPIADSTGVDHTYARWTIPGTTVKYAASHKGEGFGTPEAAANFDSFVKSYAPFDHLTLQPFSDPSIELEGAAALELASAALAASPNVQVWIYAQWPSRTEWTTDAFAAGASWDNGWEPPSAPTSWEDAVRNQLLYHEAFADFVDAKLAGKPLLIVPGGLALVELKRAIEAGEVPGTSDFFASSFGDDLHLGASAQYLVALVFYSCFYKQSAEGRASFAGTGLSDAQARIYQRIAWDVARNYPRSGITGAH